MSFDKEIESLLIQVEKPARYTGGEYNTPDVGKPAVVRVCMCFPDLYEVGMSNLGIRILYHMLNVESDVVAERCFAPHTDMGGLLKEKNLPLFSLETRKPLKEFDIIGISVQFELLYTNILYMLDLAKIPFYASERGEEYPLIIGGGPCSVNPEPFADFFDIIVIGDGEDAMTELVRLYKAHKERGYSKSAYLDAAKNIEGVYAPSHYKAERAGRFMAIGADKIVRQTYVRDFDRAYFPVDMLVPNIEAVHDRPVLELFRGCPNGCRFCQAGFYYRPIRNRSADNIITQAEKTINATGFEEISLSSLSSSDYKDIYAVIDRLSAFSDSKRVNLSLPSLRMDSFKGDMAAKSRLCSLTFAPEAGTERLRDVINKNITDEDIRSTLNEAFDAGYSSVKLYYMLGLPTENQADLDGIKQTVLNIRSDYYLKKRKRPLSVTVSAAVFVPKPLTPFQWETHIDKDTIVKRQNYLKEALKIKGVKFNWHDTDTARLETALARGDRRMSDVIVAAYSKGCKFDSWSEHIRYDLWLEAFAETGTDINAYLDEIPVDTRLPWDFIEFFVSKRHLISERDKALSGKATLSCIKGCRGCSDIPGMCVL